VQEFTVTFDLNGGELISGDAVQYVEAGEAAVAPEVEKERHTLSWDKAFTNITEDLTVTAQWEKRELSSTEVADIVQASTVTVACEYHNGNTGSGSGFFIDDGGTIVTCYHVIEYATDITVEMIGGGKYTVEKIVAFDELMDLAVLKINLSETPGLVLSTDVVKAGQAIYANGSALGTLVGTFTSGTVSNANRVVNGVKCIQIDAAISEGNSGGPLVNSYAEVIGVAAMSFLDGENLNLAIHIEQLEDIEEKNYSLTSYQEWIMREADRSYSLYTDQNTFYYSTINTYTAVTGRSCDRSVDFKDKAHAGYVYNSAYYIYKLVEHESEKYVSYLKDKGFVYADRKEYSDGVSYYYTNSRTSVQVDMFHSTDNEVWIWARYY